MSEKDMTNESIETLCRIISDAAAARSEVAGVKRAAEALKLKADQAFAAKLKYSARILREAAEDLEKIAVNLEQSDLRAKTAEVKLAAAELNRRQGL